jgi:hypothetical protein
MYQETQDQIISNHEMRHKTSDGLHIFKWCVLALFYTMTLIAFVLSILAYQRHLSPEAQLAIANLLQNVSFDGTTLVANGFSDGSGFEVSNGNVEASTLIVTNASTLNTLTVTNSSNLNGTSFNGLTTFQNVLVNGYSNSSSNQISNGVSFESTEFIAVNLPSGGGGLNLSKINTNLSKIIASGSGFTLPVSTIDAGTTWVKLNPPFSHAGIDYSSNLNIYSGIDTQGNAVYSSPTGIDGSWTLGTPYTSTFDTTPPFSIGNQFYASTTDVNFRIASSANGTSYQPQASTRSFSDMTVITSSNRIVAVGPNGPQYSDDGVNWTNGNINTFMSNVCYSSFWNKLVAVANNSTSLFSSTDGATWTTIPNLFTANSIAWSDSFQIFVAIGSTIWVSKDGMTWNNNIYNFPSMVDIKFYPEFGNFIAMAPATTALKTPQLFQI